MGPCPSTRSLLMCPFTDSFNTWMFLDPKNTLPSLGGQSDTVTISGFSGGGSMAGSMDVVYSDFIKGAGLIASGPYADKHYAGKNFGNPQVQDSINTAERFADEGLIDPTSNLKD